MEKKKYVRAVVQLCMLEASDVINSSQTSAMPDNLIDIDMFDSNLNL